MPRHRHDGPVSRVTDLVRPTPIIGATAPSDLRCRDLLPLIAQQAAEADRTRDVAPEVISAIKTTDLLALSAGKELGGLDGTVGEVALELEAIAAACASTAWCVWNHLSVFHLFCETLGPDHADLLGGLVERHQWCCFPGGARRSSLRWSQCGPPPREARCMPSSPSTST